MYKKIIISLSLIIVLSINSVLAKDYETIKLENLQIELHARKTDKSKQIEKLSSRLDRIYKLYTKKNDYSKFAKQSKLKLIDDRVVATIQPRHGILTAYIDEDKLRSFGVKIQAKAKHSMRVEIPISQLKNVATQIDGIGIITEPIKPVENAVTSEGVALMNADAWQSSGYEGIGIKIAVIDGGFDTLTQAIANGDMPSSYKSHDFTGNGLETESNHGTAVAEAIFDLVPQAEFYLYKIADGTDFENAVDTCISNNVDIANHSMSWFNAYGYYDGTGFICTIVDSAISNEILWVNSAGNSAEDHYRAIFRDAIITDSFHDFYGSGNNVNPLGSDSAHGWNHNIGEYITITLNWDEYPYTNQDYDLYLARYSGGTWTTVDTSDDRQTGTFSSYPQEIIDYENPVANGVYGVAIHRYSATNDTVDFTLFSLGRSFGFRTESSSLTDPGTLDSVVTVGAINRTNYTSGPQEYFSSQGPTTDGRPKPDVTAPDNCNSFAKGYWAGTSLSSPHTAGVCALIKSRYPAYSNIEIRNYLYTNCTSDLGTAGRDNIYGWGKVLMPDLEITVTSPNGSEDWRIDSSYDITWTSSGTSGAVQIEYSTNNGASWSNIIDSLPDTGTYSWTIPNTPSDSCLVRITDTIGNPSDISDSIFIISPASAIPFSKLPGAYSMDIKTITAGNQFEINYELPEEADVGFLVYDIKGTKFKEFSEKQPAGFYSKNVDMSDAPAGVYFIKMNANSDVFTDTRKVILVR